jgi:hypothetical protein
MQDRGTQILELAARGGRRHQTGLVASYLRLCRSPRLSDPLRDIFAAAIPIHIGERVGLPEIGESEHALL